jgi:hypothetical protein
MEGLLAPRRPLDPSQNGPHSYAIVAIHPDGVVEIPAELNMESDRVYRFLYSRLPLSGSRDVNPALADFLMKHEQQYGPQRVWSYRARRILSNKAAAGRRAAICLAVALAAILWIIVGAQLPKRVGEAWTASGGILTFSGLVFALLFRFSKEVPGGLRHWRRSGIVVTPGGLALIQGDHTGELRWPELRDLKLQTGREWFTAVRGPHLILSLAGVKVVLYDIYDRPLPLVYNQIEMCWRGRVPLLR